MNPRPLISCTTLHILLCLKNLYIFCLIYIHFHVLKFILNVFCFKNKKTFDGFEPTTFLCHANCNKGCKGFSKVRKGCALFSNITLSAKNAHAKKGAIGNNAYGPPLYDQPRQQIAFSAAKPSFSTHYSAGRLPAFVPLMR